LNPAFAKAGDIITIHFDLVDVQQEPYVVVQNSSVPVQKMEGNRYRAIYQVSSVDQDGAVKFLIRAGDEEVNTAQNMRVIMIDNTLPTLENVAMETMDGHRFVQAGDRIILKFTASERLYENMLVTVFDDTLSSIQRRGNEFSAVYELGEEDEGEIPFAIHYSDLAGNVGEAATAIAQGMPIIYKPKLPSYGTLQPIGPFTYGDDITFTWQPS